MKTAAPFALVSSLAWASLGCGSTQTVEQTRTTSAAITVERSEEKSAAEKWAEDRVAAEVRNAKGAPRGEKDKGGDPLAVSDALEDAAIPRIEATPAAQLRAKSRRDLDQAVALVGTASSVEAAAKKLTVRLGKPSWTENGARRIWVAAAGAKCHRLVLEADGSVEVETADKSEGRMLTATARQNPCTGEIKRGIEK